MDLNVNYIPYIRRKVPFRVKVQPFRHRDHIDRKNSYFIIKRVVDILVSSLFIGFVLIWALPLIAILIRMDSRGPIMFLQKRTGRGGRPFICYKLRTMRVNEEADLLPARENDQRVTRLGKILRTFNLDELPQFFNVLMGTMSLVGPRPHMINDCNRFSQVVPGYKFRNMVKPGITGLAQVEGYRGPALDNGRIFRRYGWDAFYVRNLSLSMDMRVIRKTMGLFFIGRSSA